MLLRGKVSGSLKCDDKKHRCLLAAQVTAFEAEGDMLTPPKHARLAA